MFKHDTSALVQMIYHNNMIPQCYTTCSPSKQINKDDFDTEKET